MDLLIPVYLNQRMVFDLLAMLRGGIAQVTDVSSTVSAASQGNMEVSARSGIGGVLSQLFKVELDATAEARSNSDSSVHHRESRVHTAASLLYELRKELVSKNLLHSNGASTPNPGEFVEIEAMLTRNPFVEAMHRIAGMLEFAALAEVPNKGQKGRRDRSSEGEFTGKQLEIILTSLRSGVTTDLIARDHNGVTSAVVTLEQAFLNDAEMLDLVDGQFRVLGKVVRKVEGENNSISLLRNTAFHTLPFGVIDNFKNVFDDLKEVHGFSIPTLQTEVDGPAIQILPIAIYA